MALRGLFRLTYMLKNTALLAIWPDGMVSDSVSRCHVLARRNDQHSGVLIGQMERGDLIDWERVALRRPSASVRRTVDIKRHTLYLRYIKKSRNCQNTLTAHSEFILPQIAQFCARALYGYFPYGYAYSYYSTSALSCVWELTEKEKPF